jgi:hypothetical protein
MLKVIAPYGTPGERYSLFSIGSCATMMHFEPQQQKRVAR